MRRGPAFTRLLWLFLTPLLCACSTMTTPVLRHETGETLGAKRIKVAAKYESSRIYTFVPSGSPVNGIPQEGQIFQGSLFGLQGTVGVMQKIDFQLGWFLSYHGAGWRVGGKYQILRKNRLAVAGMLGYGADSSSGTVSYFTAMQPLEIDQTLSANTVDLSVPVSYRLTPGVAAYSGLMLFRSGITGTAGGVSVSGLTFDVGSNLGFRLNLDQYEADIEAAFLRIYDPFVDGYRIVPYVGVSVGIIF